MHPATIISDPVAIGTLKATWVGSISALVAAISALWVTHQANVREDRRRLLEDRDKKLAFETAVKLAIRKVGSMTNTIDDTGDGAITKALFVRGVDSAQIAITYALQLGVADSCSLETALDARGAFDLLSAMMAAFEPSQFVGDGLAATRGDIQAVMTALYTKHPAVGRASRDTAGVPSPVSHSNHAEVTHA